MGAAGVVLIISVVLIVAAAVVYLLATIAALRRIAGGLDDAIAGVGRILEQTAPVAEVVGDINAKLDAGVDLLEGLLVKKAGRSDAVALIDGLYPGAGDQGLRNFPGSGDIRRPRIGEVYTRGTLTLARLGREAPIAATSPNGPAMRSPSYGSTAARLLYPEVRQQRPARMPRSPVIGTGSPVQYDPDLEVGAPRRRMPPAAGAPPAVAPAPTTPATSTPPATAPATASGASPGATERS